MKLTEHPAHTFSGTGKHQVGAMVTRSCPPWAGSRKQGRDKRRDVRAGDVQLTAVIESLPEDFLPPQPEVRCHGVHWRAGRTGQDVGRREMQVADRDGRTTAVQRMVDLTQRTVDLRCYLSGEPAGAVKQQPKRLAQQADEITANGGLDVASAVRVHQRPAG